ncbi:hypothetical protein ABBQ38_006573 [Trebouxia sp. C0009 RCD-2024]
MVPVVFQAEVIDQTDAQLKKERLYQAATHVMVQRSAVLQIDLDQTADMLCKTMQDAIYQETQLLEAQTRCHQERHLRVTGMAVVTALTSKVELQQQKLSAMESLVAGCR